MPYGHTYCKKCEPIAQAQKEARMRETKRKSDKRYNQTRDQKYIRFYNSSDWRALSARYTQDKGYRCEDCGQLAAEVHHIKAIQTDAGWERRLDYHNLKLLCKDCHNKAHNRFQPHRGHF